MDAGTKAFRLEIDSTTTPLSGRLAPDGATGEPTGFVGWTGLAATLERLLETTGDEPATNDERQRGTR